MFMLNLPATAHPDGACRINGRHAEYRLFPDRIEFRYDVADPWESSAIIRCRTLGGITLYVCDGAPADDDHTVQTDADGNDQAARPGGTTSPFRMHVCCPDAGCGTYRRILDWLRSLGMEPSIEEDASGHYLVVELPDDATDPKRIEFFWGFAHRYEGAVYCRCGKWHRNNPNAFATRITCHGCGKEYMFCEDCDAIVQWAGCDCTSDD